MLRDFFISVRKFRQAKQWNCLIQANLAIPLKVPVTWIA